MRLAPAFVLVTALLAAPAFAAPSYWRVTGVAADDTLNVRAEPDAASDDIGDLLPDTRGIEVIDTDASGDWGRIVWEEGNGWIAMSFLEPDPQPEVTGSALPVGLLCSGTEPFWFLRFSDAAASFTMDGSSVEVAIDGATSAVGRPAFPVYLGLSGDAANGFAIVRDAQCSDGMSDRVYPWTADVVLGGETFGFYILGCCELPLEEGAH